MSDIAIKVEGLSKVYKLYDKPIDRMKESLHPLRKRYHRDFFALNDVSFEIKKGETIGIIGKNGSGKSTLLKILTGVLTPSSGVVQVNGKVSALLELGAGFNPEFTGLENVYFNGSIMGYTHDEMDAKIDDILSFADIGEFVHQPVKTYSSGMFVRLAFALAVNVDPDILIVDEALSVGDIRFQLRCMRRMQEIQENGATFLFVSHSMESVKRLCRRAVWLNDGEIHREGSSKSVAEEFHAFMCHGLTVKSVEDNNASEAQAVDANDSLDPLPSNANTNGEGGIEILGVGLYTKSPLKKVHSLEGGEDVIFRYRFKTAIAIEEPLLAFIVYDKNGTPLFGANSFVLDKKYGEIKPNSIINVIFEFNFPKLRDGEYVISLGINDGTQTNHIRLLVVFDSYVVNISSDELKRKQGLCFTIDNIELSIY